MKRIKQYPFHPFVWGSFILGVAIPKLLIHDQIGIQTWIIYSGFLLLFSTLPVAITAKIAARQQWVRSWQTLIKFFLMLLVLSLLPILALYFGIKGAALKYTWAIVIPIADLVKNVAVMIIFVPKKADGLLTASRAGSFALIIVGALTIVFMAPNYCDYSGRTYVSEGMALATAAKWASSEFYEQEKRFPKNNEEAGVPNPNEITGQAVKSIEIRPNGLIVITYNKRVKDNVELHLQARFEDKMINWACIKHDAPQRQIDARDLPANCRGQIYPNGK